MGSAWEISRVKKSADVLRLGGLAMGSFVVSGTAFEGFLGCLQDFASLLTRMIQTSYYYWGVEVGRRQVWWAMAWMGSENEVERRGKGYEGEGRILLSRRFVTG